VLKLRWDVEGVGRFIFAVREIIEMEVLDWRYDGASVARCQGEAILDALARFVGGNSEC
jgi:hypothetical protein